LKLSQEIHCNETLKLILNNSYKNAFNFHFSNKKVLISNSLENNEINIIMLLIEMIKQDNVNLGTEQITQFKPISK